MRKIGKGVMDMKKGHTGKWIVSLIGLAVVVAVAFALRDDGKIRLQDGRLTGIRDNWLVAKIGNEYEKLGEVSVPEGYAPMEGLPANSMGAEPELYYAPKDASPVQFLFYTSASGDARSLAETAVEVYASFYDDYAATEIASAEIAGKEAIWFSYTCSYPDEDHRATVYAQNVVCYFPVRQDACVAMIVSCGFDSAQARMDGEAMLEMLQFAGSALRLEEK